MLKPKHDEYPVGREPAWRIYCIMCGRDELRRLVEVPTCGLPLCPTCGGRQMVEIDPKVTFPVLAPVDWNSHIGRNVLDTHHSNRKDLNDAKQVG